MAISGLRQGQNRLDASTIIIHTPFLSKNAQQITATILWGESRCLPFLISSGGLLKVLLSQPANFIFRQCPNYLLPTHNLEMLHRICYSAEEGKLG